MAEEATHIRFALEFKDVYQVADLEKYISGSVYPDSRYATGIERTLTHPDDFLESDFFQQDDFKKGWFTHLLCDHIQLDIYKERFPKLFEGILRQGSDVWVHITALKILQDIDDIKKFDISAYSSLRYVANPNGEDLEVVRSYNKSLSEMYAEPKKIDIDTLYHSMKNVFRIEEEVAMKVKLKAEEYQQNETMMDGIKEIYDETVKRAKVQKWAAR